jgi:geranylgeranyl diphosphate synthase type I
VSKQELSGFIGHWLPQVEAEMRAVLANAEAPLVAHYGMMHYHLGWADAAFQPQVLPSGKRLRPIFCLLACQESGGDPAAALPAAAAIEILHNFSLIHDDIEDGDELRRHRPTVWKLWGAPQAINAGDGMFALAFAAMQRLSGRGVPAQVTLDSLHLFTRTCVALTEGQHLDMAFERRDTVTVAEYLRMIRGKTAALVGASVAIGGLVGSLPLERGASLIRFGEAVGLAFQIQDDILGIWGDPAVTGKAAGNDLLRRKKSLPLLYALNHPISGSELHSVLVDPFDAADLPAAMALLAQAGAREFAEQEMQRQHAAAVDALHAALGAAAGDSALLALAESLLHRQM